MSRSKRKKNIEKEAQGELKNVRMKGKYFAVSEENEKMSQLNQAQYRMRKRMRNQNQREREAEKEVERDKRRREQMDKQRLKENCANASSNRRKKQTHEEEPER